MKRRRGNVGRYKPTSFYDPNVNKTPAWKFILPLLMVLVIVGAVYMAYRDSLPENHDDPSTVTSATVSDSK